jgi:hypothetical protein
MAQFWNKRPEFKNRIPMKIASLSLFVALCINTISAQQTTEKPQKVFYCGMQYDQDTTKLLKYQSDTLLKVKPQEIRVKQSKKSLPVKTAKPEPMRRND